MDKALGDPLLVAAKLATIVARIALVIGMVVIGVAMTVTVIGAAGLLPDEVVIGLGDALAAAPAWAAVLAMFAALIALGLMYDFAGLLAQIIDTVGEGDPFTAANAGRLTRMAWLALAVQGMTLVTTLLESWAGSIFREQTVELESDLSLTALALALVLFILARVFRKGAEMRAELEGTV